MSNSMNENVFPSRQTPSRWSRRRSRSRARGQNRARLPQSIPSNQSAQVSRKLSGARRNLRRLRRSGQDPSLFAQGIDVPFAQMNVSRSGGPKWMASRPGTTRIRHREYVADLTPGVAAVYNSYLINPGNSVLFPWLHGMVLGWEKYKFLYLAFHYQPVCSVATEGEVGMLIDYDCKDVAVDTYSDFTNTKGAVTSQFYTPLICPLNKADTVRKEPLLTTVVEQSTEMLNYYCGKFQTYLSIGTATAKGKLFVEYEVELSVPQPIPMDYAYYLDLNDDEVLVTNVLADYYTAGGVINAEEGIAWAYSLGVLTCKVPGVYLVSINITSANTGGATLAPIGTATSSEYHEADMGTTSILTVSRVVADYGDTLDFSISAGFTVTDIDIRIGKYVVF